MPYQPQPYVYQSALGTDPTPSPEGWFKKHKKRLFIGGALVIGLAVILLVVLFLVNRHAANVALDEAAIQTASRTCDNVKDPEGCLATIQPDLAYTTGKSSFCNGLDGDVYDNCVGLAALAGKSTDDCKKINDTEKRDVCLRAVTVLLAEDAGTYEACDQITNDTSKTDCQGMWIVKHMIAGTCVQPPMTSEECSTGVVLKDAIDKRDPDLCAGIIDQQAQVICYETVGAGDKDLDGLGANREKRLGTDDTLVDSDGDGLSDADEYNQWKTNPAEKDTDGDGFNDGDEVSKGYNPNGSGNL